MADYNLIKEATEIDNILENAILEGDSRLSDARVPLAHTHTPSECGAAAASHTHTMSQITDSTGVVKDTNYVHTDNNYTERDEEVVGKFFVSGLTLNEDTDEVEGEEDDVIAALECLNDGQTPLLTCSSSENSVIVANTCSITDGSGVLTFSHNTIMYVVVITSAGTISTEMYNISDKADYSDIEPLQKYRGAVLSSSPTLTSAATSIALTLAVTDLPHTEGDVIGGIKVAGTWYDITITNTSGSTIDASATVGSNTITLNGMRTSGHTMTITNTAGLTIEAVYIH